MAHHTLGFAGQRLKKEVPVALAKHHPRVTCFRRRWPRTLADHERCIVAELNELPPRPQTVIETGTDATGLELARMGPDARGETTGFVERKRIRAIAKPLTDLFEGVYNDGTRTLEVPREWPIAALPEETHCRTVRGLLPRIDVAKEPTEQWMQDGPEKLIEDGSEA